jgi:glycosyltransferase involved in cell wall biosynthesis
MEYMAFGLPVVAFDLRETRVSAGDSAVYVEPNDVGLFARAVVGLLDHPELRSTMGRIGRERVVDELAWEHQERAYLDVFEDLAHATTDARR